MLNKKSLINHKIQLIFLFLLFCFLAAIFINLPIFEIAQKIPHHIDAHLVSWIWSWETHILPTHPLNLFQANIFAPFNNTLAFSETMLGSFLLALPILLIFNNVVLAFNLVVILSFAISGLGMYLLVFYLTKNKWAAFLSALIYAFAPFKLMHSDHLHLSGMWLPFVFLYLHKFFKNNSWKNVLLLTLFIILVFLTGFHYFIFLPIVLGIFGFTYILTKKFQFSQDNIRQTITALIILSLFTIPLILSYLQTKEDYGLIRPIEDIQNYSPALVDYFTSPFFYTLHNTTETSISPGIIIILLFILSIYIFKKNKKFLFLASENKKIFIIYFFISLIAFLVSFGLYINLTQSSPIKIPGLYAVFYYLVPIFKGIRSPGRYSIFVLLPMSVFIGYGISLWNDQIKDIFKKIVLFFIIITFLFIELSFVPATIFLPILNSPDEQKLYDWIKNQPDDKIFLELPMGFIKDERMTNFDINYVFNSRLHFKKIVNGYSGYYPPGYLELMERLKSFEQEDIPEIKKFQANYLIFHFDSYQNPAELKLEIAKKAEDNHQIKYITHFNNNYVYEIVY